MRPFVFLLPLLLACCAGYQLGGIKPTAMREVETIAVPMFKNDTLHPRAEALATSVAADAFVLDGTYRVSSSSGADAILEGTLREVRYQLIRSVRLDTLRPEELQNTVRIDWVVRDGRNATRILAQGSSFGSSRFFVGSNLQTSRNNALPDALERASQAMVSRLADGF